MLRQEVAAFVELGPLPDSEASVEEVTRHEQLLLSIPEPITDEEAEALLRCFGPDDCFGLAWELLHKIESAPGSTQVKAEPPPDANEWIHRLWQRAENGRLYKAQESKK